MAGTGQGQELLVQGPADALNILRIEGWDERAAGCDRRGRKGLEREYAIRSLSTANMLYAVVRWDAEEEPDQAALLCGRVQEMIPGTVVTAGPVPAPPE